MKIIHTRGCAPCLRTPLYKSPRLMVSGKGQQEENVKVTAPILCTVCPKERKKIKVIVNNGQLSAWTKRCPDDNFVRPPYHICTLDH